MSDTHLAAAVAAFRAGDLAVAAARCRDHLADRGEDARAHHLLGLIALRDDRADEALAALERAEALAPGREDVAAATGAAWSARAWAAEQRNDDDQAHEGATRALARLPGDFQARFVLARVAEKAGQLDRARSAYEHALMVAATDVNQALVIGRQAQLAERAGRHREAFELADRANGLLRPRARELAGTSVYGLPAVRDFAAFLTPERLARWARDGEALTAADQAAAAPIFLVGFPRSGTTLLDRILAAHPALEVLEERDTLGSLLSTYAADRSRLALLDGVDAARRIEARERYRAQVRAEGASGSRVVDKLPLNSIYLGLIHRLFPDARILFAIRDPRDVCLSCFFQTFGLNEAMSQFLDWEGTARYYAAVQQLAWKTLDALPIPVAPVRYEALVAAPGEALDGGLRLLGLAWDPAMDSFRDQLAGQRIDTPSYDQVTRPLHRGAIGRWRAHAERFEPVAPLLDPWIDRLGYRGAGGWPE